MPDKKKTQELLTHAASQMRVMDVLLREMEVRVSDKLNPLLPNQEFVFQFRFRPIRQRVQTLHRADDDAAKEVVIVEYHVVAGARFLDPSFVGSENESESEKPDSDSVLAEITATFAASYARNECSDEGVKAFGKLNVPYHVWPYWRELLQNTLARMKLPSVTLGMYLPSKGVHAPASLDDPDSLRADQDD